MTPGTGEREEGTCKLVAGAKREIGNREIEIKLVSGKIKGPVFAATWGWKAVESTGNSGL